MKNHIKTKFLGIALALTLFSGTIGTITANAVSCSYGSDVNVSGLMKYGYAWTQLAGANVRARIVMGGSISDVSNSGYAQTKQISNRKGYDANIGHYVNGQVVALLTK